MSRGKGRKPQDFGQLGLPFGEARRERDRAALVRQVPGRAQLRILNGEGRGRDERLQSRDDVARVLMRSAADLLLRRISSARANAIQRMVDRVFTLFDTAAHDSSAATLLRHELDSLEELARPRSRTRENKA